MSDAVQPHSSDAQRSSENSSDNWCNWWCSICKCYNCRYHSNSSVVHCAFEGILQVPGNLSVRFQEQLWSRIIAYLDKLKILEEVEIMQSSVQESARNPVPVQTAEKSDDERKPNGINLLIHLMLLCVNRKDVLRDMRQIQVDCKIENFQVCHLILHTLAGLVNQWMLIQQLQLVFHDSKLGAVHCVPIFCKEPEKIHGEGSSEIFAVFGSLRHLLEMWPRTCNSDSAEFTPVYMAEDGTPCSDWEFQTLGSCQQLLGWESSGQCQKHEFSVAAWTFQASQAWDSCGASFVFMGLHTCVLDQKSIWCRSRGDILWAQSRTCLSRTFVPICRASDVLCWGHHPTQRLHGTRALWHTICHKDFSVEP